MHRERVEDNDRILRDVLATIREVLRRHMRCPEPKGVMNAFDLPSTYL